jgi:hypothetical protein
VAYSNLEQSTDLYSIDFVDIIHVGQAAHQLPDNSVKPRAEASTGYNACFHFIRLKVNLTRFKYKYFCQTREKCGQQPNEMASATYPLTGSGTTEVNPPPAILLNNNL